MRLLPSPSPPVPRRVLPLPRLQMMPSRRALYGQRITSQGSLIPTPFLCGSALCPRSLARLFPATDPTAYEFIHV